MNFFYIYAILLCIESLTASRRDSKDRSARILKGINILLSNQSNVDKKLNSFNKELTELSSLLEYFLPSDCSAAQTLGKWMPVTKIKPPGLPLQEVQCDQLTLGGGWTVVVSRESTYSKFRSGTGRRSLRDLNSNSFRLNSLRRSERKDTSESFNRTWEEYKQGFGDPTKEYWIGNEVLHILTKDTPWEAMVILENWKDEKVQAFWSNIRILSESENYKLEISGYRKDRRDVGDSLAYHNGKKFSTFDKENDSHDKEHCALKYGGGWWFHMCHVSYLTGVHLAPDQEGEHAVHWYHWKNNLESLKKAKLMIRPKGAGKP